MQNALIIGWHREAINLYKKIHQLPALGYSVKGFISVQNNRTDEDKSQIPLLGGISTLQDNIHEHNISEVLIAISPEEQKSLPEVLQICEQNDVHYTIVSDVYDIVYGQATRDVFRDVFQPREFSLSRILDFFGALYLIISFLPLFLVVALAIKIESRGSIFVSYKRMGRNGRPYRMYKFRTQIRAKSDIRGPLWALKEDVQHTRVGNFLRQTQIDELGQLLNVLKGDMGFIGPEPDNPLFHFALSKQLPLYKSRLKVKPGITGWAQVHWNYEETLEDHREKLKYDLYYIKNRSVRLDMKIILQLLKRLLTGDTA